MISLKRRILAKSIGALPDRIIKPFFNDAILMYHRIIEPKTLAFPLESGMYVKPETFWMQLKYLRNHYEIVSLSEFINSKNKGHAKNLLALTFDDGWSDFYQFAYPILKEFKIPATVFLPTAYIDTNNLFWTDHLALILSNINHKDNFLNKLSKITSNQELSSLDSIIEVLKNLNITKRKNLFKEFTQEANLTKEISRQFMSWKEIQEISKEKLISFQCHSHCHELLTKLSNDELIEDLKTNISIMKDKLMEEQIFFCYPNQTRNNRTDKALESLGFKIALGKLNKGEDCADLNIPIYSRIGVHEDIGSEVNLFKLRLLGI